MKPCDCHSATGPLVLNVRQTLRKCKPPREQRPSDRRWLDIDPTMDRHLIDVDPRALVIWPCASFLENTVWICAHQNSVYTRIYYVKLSINTDNISISMTNGFHLFWKSIRKSEALTQVYYMHYAVRTWYHLPYYRPFVSFPNDVIMSAMASQITSLTIVYSTVYSGSDERKHQSSASLAFVRGIHRWPMNSPHKGPVTRKMFPFDDAIMLTRTVKN